MSIPACEKQPGAARRVIAQAASPTGLTVLALCGVTLAFYHRLWLPGLVLIKRDAFRFFLPLKQYLVDRLHGGDLPQWFPYEGLGRPFIGVTHTGVFHPFTALYALLPVPDAYRALTLLTCLLAALGAFALGRMLGLSRAGALLAGIAFALSGYVVSLTDNLLYLYSICLLPFFCAALDKALAARRLWVVAPAALWASVFLNGDIQTGYYFGFIAVAWTLMRAPGSYLEAGLRLGITGALATLLAGIQLGPAWAVFTHSERVLPAAFLDQALHWSTHPMRLATILAGPVGAQADPVAVGRVFFGSQLGGLWAESLYLGVPVIGLGLIGAWARRDLRVLAMLGAVTLILALGRYGGLFEVFYHVVPLWSAFRYPEKLMGIASFAAAMLAGAGLDALRERQYPSLPWLAMAMLCATAGFVLGTEAAAGWTAAHFGAPADLGRTVAGSAARAFQYSGAVTLGMWLLAAGTRAQALRQTVAPSLLILLVTVDLARANMGAYHTGPAEAATFTPPLAEAVRAREGTLAAGRFRLIAIHEDILVWPEDLMRTLDYDGAGSVARRQALDAEHNAQFHLETVSPYLSGHSSQLARTLNARTGMEAAARLNAKYYTGRRYHLSDPRLSRGLVAQLPPYDLALFLNPVPAKPRAYLSRQPKGAGTPIDPMSLFTRPDFLHGDLDLIETSEPALPGPALSGQAVIERYRPEEVRVQVDTPKPAVLILLDAFEQGWTATLENGAPIPILRANALVRAVVVPAGAHTVTFAYKTPLLRAGAWASLAGVLLCAGLLAQTQWEERRRKTHA